MLVVVCDVVTLWSGPTRTEDPFALSGDVRAMNVRAMKPMSLVGALMGVFCRLLLPIDQDSAADPL